jgi:hypothetical protein
VGCARCENSTYRSGIDRTSNILSWDDDDQEVGLWDARWGGGGVVVVESVARVARLGFTLCRVCLLASLGSRRKWVSSLLSMPSMKDSLHSSISPP